MKPFHEWIGFDMDHALVRYKLEALYPLIFDCLRTYLVNSVPEYKLLRHVKFDETFCQKGVIFDARTGDFIKLDEAGHVISACHGNQITCGRRRSLAGGWFSRQQIREKYHSKTDHWSRLEALERQEKGGYFQFSTYFDIPAAQLIGELVQITDTQVPAPKDYRRIMQHMFKAFNACFSPEHFSDASGGYFSELKAHTDRYVEASDSLELKKHLAHLRTSGTKLALITNSHVDYSELLMRFSFGSDWRKMFDLTVFYARKGQAFFKVDEPFRHVQEPELDGKQLVFRNDPGPEAAQLSVGGAYIGGSSQRFKQFIGDDASMLYLGDNVKSDVFIPKKMAKWEVVAIVEECADDRGRQECDTLRTRPFLARSRWDSFFTCFHVGPAASPKSIIKKRSPRGSARSPRGSTASRSAAASALSCETRRSWSASFIQRHADAVAPSALAMLRQYCAQRNKHMWSSQRRHIFARVSLIGAMGLATLFSAMRQR